MGGWASFKYSTAETKTNSPPRCGSCNKTSKLSENQTYFTPGWIKLDQGLRGCTTYNTRTPSLGSVQDLSSGSAAHMALLSTACTSTTPGKKPTVYLTFHAGSMPLRRFAVAEKRVTWSTEPTQNAHSFPSVHPFSLQQLAPTERVVRDHTY